MVSILPVLIDCDWVSGQNRGERVRRVKDFIRQGKQTAEGELAFAFFVRRCWLGGMGEVLVPAGNIAVELAKAAMPAVRFKLGLVQPRDEVEPVHGGQTRFSLLEFLLHTGEHGVPDHEIHG